MDLIQAFFILYNMKKLPIGIAQNRRNWLYFKNDPYVNGVCAEGKFIFETFIYNNIQKYNVEMDGKTVIDIGANMGSHTVEFAHLVGENGQVVAFEPSRLVYYQLCGNVIANGLYNVHCENVALGNEISTVRIEDLDYFSESVNSGNTHVDKNGSYSVTSLALDHYEIRNPSLIKNVSLIKIDVQGYEPYVLDGAIKTIKTNRPTIFIEIEPEHLSRFGFTEKDVFNRLHKLDYKIIHDHQYDYVAIPI